MHRAPTVMLAALLLGCGGRDQPIEPIPDVGPMPDAFQGCATANEPAELVARLGAQDGKYVVTIKNVGCADAVRVVGCCSEGDPVVERREAGGSWVVSGCIPKPEMCCAAMPMCTTLGGGVELPIQIALTQCPAGVYRVKVAYGDAPCAAAEPWDTKTPRLATSNAVQVK